jgi:hypothetical protein
MMTMCNGQRGFMIDLIIIACLVAQPTQCRPHIVPAEGSARQCMRTALPVVAAWAGRHPEWRIARFDCRSHDKEA